MNAVRIHRTCILIHYARSARAVCRRVVAVPDRGDRREAPERGACPIEWVGVRLAQAALLQRERFGLGPEGVAPHVVQQLLVLGTVQRAIHALEEVEQAHLLLLIALVLEPGEEHAAQAERCREDEYIARHAPMLPAGCTATGSLHERDVVGGCPYVRRARRAP